jgi:hypothetical protein
MDIPFRAIAPPFGGKIPVITLKSVVFPAPLGPMIALMIPGGTLKLRPFKAWTPPKDFCRFSTWRKTGELSVFIYFSY